MFKMKLPFCVILVLSLWAVFVFGSSESESEPKLSLSKKSELSLVFERLEAQDERIRELEKSREKLKEQVKYLNKKVDGLTDKDSSGRGVWLLTPPLRGPPGKKGEKGEAGEIGLDGQKGESGRNGEAGQKGEPGQNVESGRNVKAGPEGGQTSPTGQKGGKGDSSGFRVVRVDYQTTSTSTSTSTTIHPVTSVPMTTNPTKEVQWRINRPGENWIVAEEISRFEPNGRWGNPQLCPPTTFVTAHKFTYFANRGLTGVQLTCTPKHNMDERESQEENYFLRITSAEDPEISEAGEEWDNSNRGSRSNFAEGFSLNLRVMDRRGSTWDLDSDSDSDSHSHIRKTPKTYDMIYLGQNPKSFALVSTSVVTKCPQNHAICGLIPMMDNRGLGILSAVGFKCCDICKPEEKWVTVHRFRNTKSTNETAEFNATVGFQKHPQNLKPISTLSSTNLNVENTVKISPSDFYQEFSAHLGNSNSTGFDWTAAAVSMGTEEEETSLTKTYTCEAKSSCVYKQLVGQCGNIRIPVDKFVQVSIPEDESRHTSCSVAVQLLPYSRTEKHRIYPHGNESSTSLEVLCDFESDGGGWTIIQKRSSGPKQEFNKNWNEYVNGFGSLDGNFWLGLENIHALTKNGDQELRIELEGFRGEKRWAKYWTFSISDASDFYRLAIGGFYDNSTADDSMSDLGVRFTTKDKDNDEDEDQNCAELSGGWWFSECYSSNLNGLYYEKGERVKDAQGIFWDSWSYFNYVVKTEMKIRTRK